MSYVRKAITSDEKLLAIFRPHWIYVAEGLFWLAALTILGFVIDYYLYTFIGMHAIKFKMDLWVVQFDEKNTPIPWMFLFAGLAVFWPLFLGFISTEVGLTDQRIIRKKGVIFVEIDQVDLEDIRAEHVVHGWLGWLLGYGRVRLDCRFVEDVWLPAIRNPYRLIKASHTARMKNPAIDYTHDMLQDNLGRIAKQQQENRAHWKIEALKNRIKANFRRAS